MPVPLFARSAAVPTVRRLLLHACFHTRSRLRSRACRIQIHILGTLRVTAALAANAALLPAVVQVRGHPALILAACVGALGTARGAALWRGHEVRYARVPHAVNADPRRTRAGSHAVPVSDEAARIPLRPAALRDPHRWRFLMSSLANSSSAVGSALASSSSFCDTAPMSSGLLERLSLT